MSLPYTRALLTLASHNFDALVLFYQKLLGQSPVIYREEVYAEFHLPDLKLGIFHPREADIEEQVYNQEYENFSVGRSPTGISLCFDVEQLEAAIACLADLGCPPPSKIFTASHGREIYAYDPDGNCLILHEKRREGTEEKCFEC